MATNLHGLGEVVELDTKELLNFFDDILSLMRAQRSKTTPTDAFEMANAGNALLKSEEFNAVFSNVLSSVAAHLGVQQMYVQRHPTFRVQQPGAKSVSFHTDDLSSGHGAQIANFWVALSDVNSLNGLHLVAPTQSQKLLNDFKKQKWSLEELDRRARDVAEAKPLSAGEAICFSNRVLHGTVANDSPETRVSIDFRCLPREADPGTRILGYEFVEFPPKASKREPTPVTSVIFQSGNVSHIGHQAQREVIHDFARRRGFRVIRETSEWHHLDHYPVLEELLMTPDPAPVLIFSHSSFAWGSEKGARLADMIKQYGSEVYFCLEDQTGAH